uniref:hypothetical protein n=1 Tax=Streptomyces achromogenes TaxID=67255 RepID=UPI003F49A75A
MPAPKREAGHPLALGEITGARLRNAVYALLEMPGLDGALDTVRLAVIVLASRTPSETGEVVIRTGELGRWIGLSASRTASSVVPGLRRSGMVEVETEPGEFGQDDALRCRVLPMWKARGVVGHPLHLTKIELATLLRLMEAVMAPGWTHRDGRVTPAGLLGQRTGRGAATDRLALLLLVLEARETGRVRLCGGRVSQRYGRPAATLARLLGCSLSRAERVLARLEDAELVKRPRKRTVSGLQQEARLVVPAVAAAHGSHRVDAGSGGRQAGSGGSDRGVGDLAGTAWPGSGSLPSEKPQVNGVRKRCGSDAGDLANTADLHTDHPHLGTAVSSPAVSRGFSGEGRDGIGRRPERACAREDRAVDGEEAAAGSASSVAEDGPLRGEKPKEFPGEGCGGRHAAGALAGEWPKVGGSVKAQRQRRVTLPADLGLRVALGPVAGLWQRLSGWQQEQVEAAAEAELYRLAGLLERADAAPRLLAGRLTDRLAETGGEALVKRPYPWLIRRGLVQRQACTDRRCDDGIRLDTGGECGNCGNVIHIRRARRAKAVAEIERELPGLSDRERRRVLEERLRERAAIEAENQVRRREQARAEQARRDAARAAAQEQAELERAAAAAADVVRQALPCEDCGLQRSGGLCEACGFRHRTEAAIAEAGLIAATWSADLTDPGNVAVVTADVRAALERDIAAARADYLHALDPADQEADPVGTAAALAYGALHAVQEALPEYRRCALAMLGRTEEAEAEARRAYKAEQGRPWFRHNPAGADAVAAATKAAAAARERTAEYLLAARLEQLREQTEARSEAVAPASWTDRLPGLASCLLDGEAAGVVIA